MENLRYVSTCNLKEFSRKVKNIQNANSKYDEIKTTT